MNNKVIIKLKWLKLKWYKNFFLFKFSIKLVFSIICLYMKHYFCEVKNICSNEEFLASNNKPEFEDIES